MKKLLSILICSLVLFVLAVPALAAPEEPQITLQPQNYHYPEYSVAIYTVQAEGSNLRATWYLAYEGKTYNLSDMANGFEPWEAYAGESYGPAKLDDHTFMFFFGGIEAGLNGAEIWCVLEDGHYDVTSARAFITVQGDEMPPEILSIPASVSANRNEETIIRCVARSVGESFLNFQWYETPTGKLQDIRAIDGQECDYLICSTESPGTRYYVCCVTDTAGGMVYSSVVPVTVADSDPIPQGKAPTFMTKELPQGTVGEDYGFILETDDYSAEFSVYYNPGGPNDFEKTGLKLSVEGMLMGKLTKAGTYTFTICVSNPYGEDHGTLTLKVVDPTETTQPTVPETVPTVPPDTVPQSVPTTPPDTVPQRVPEPVPTQTQAQPQAPVTPQQTPAFPWWGYPLLILSGVCAGVGIAFLFINLKKKH